MNTKSGKPKYLLMGSPDHFDTRSYANSSSKAKSSGGFLCCTKDQSSKETDTNIWMRENKNLKPLPKYKQYESPK